MGDPIGIDIGGPLRSSDSSSTTEVRLIKHTHVWTIPSFSQTSIKIKVESALVISGVQAHSSESNRDFSFFQVLYNNANAKCVAKFFLFNRRNEEIPTILHIRTQQFHGNFEYISSDLFIGHVQPRSELQLVLNLTITLDPIIPVPLPSNIGKDFEAMFKEDGRLPILRLSAGIAK